MKSCIFIAGTGTDVGKTVVTAGLLRLLRGRGIDAVSMKPVQTGAEWIDGSLMAPDLIVHWTAAGFLPDPVERALMGPYLYEPACSPHLAGRMAGSYPEIGRIVSCARALLDSHEALLIEGAGGLMAPLDETRTMIDLMKALDCPALIVAHRGLGTINHTLLSLAALRAAEIEVAGVVLNETRDEPRDFIRADNPNAIAKFGAVRILGDVDYFREFDDAAWDRFAACMPGLDELAQGLRNS